MPTAPWIWRQTGTLSLQRRDTMPWTSLIANHRKSKTSVNENTSLYSCGRFITMIITEVKNYSRVAYQISCDCMYEYRNFNSIVMIRLICSPDYYSPHSPKLQKCLKKCVRSKNNLKIFKTNSNVRELISPVFPAWTHSFISTTTMELTPEYLERLRARIPSSVTHDE